MRTREIYSIAGLAVVWLVVATGQVFGWNQAPIAVAKAYPQWVFKPCGTEVCLDGSDSYDLDGWISQWSWTFGDGGGWTSGYGDPPDCENPNYGVRHQYNQVGRYWACLTVWDNCGLYDYDYTVVYVADFGMSVADPIVRVGDVTAVTIWANTPSSTTTTLSFSASNLNYCRLWLDQARTQALTNPSWQLTGGYFQTSFYLEPITWYTGQLYAGLATPGWDGSCEYGCCQVQFGVVQILEPDGDPNTDNNFVFNSATPGVSQVMATGMSGKPACDPNLEWAISGISGSVLTSSPSPPRGNWIIFSYTGLPSSNSAFGPKTLTLRDLGCTGLPAQYREDTQQVEIFFSRDAMNHPDPCSGVTPNWYYYWSQTSASSGNHKYNSTLPSDGCYTFGNNYFEIGPSAKDQDYGLVEKGDGIDNFGSTCLHERAHMEYFLNTWGTMANYLARKATEDKDGDYLKDTDEPSLLGLNSAPYNPALKDTNGDTYDDFEDYACKHEDTWEKGSCDSQDWADPGHQTSR